MSSEIIRGLVNVVIGMGFCCDLIDLFSSHLFVFNLHFACVFFFFSILK